MTKKVYDKVEDIPEEGGEPVLGIKDPVLEKPCKKKKKPAPPGTAINPMTGNPYPPGPPGCNHG